MFSKYLFFGLVLYFGSSTLMAIEPVLIVHGGSGLFSPDIVAGKMNGMKKALEAGYRILLQKKNSLDAVEEAVRIMEDDENFNAGFGSVLTSEGQVEMDAAIMNGASLKAGCVSIVKSVKHPIKLARLLLDSSEYVFLAGTKGTTEFAIKNKMEVLPFKALVSEKAKKALAAYQAELNGNSLNETVTEEMDKHLDVPEEAEVGTVGAVAIDINGNISVATSTGGAMNKPSGHVSDSPILGSGTYADNTIGGVSASGDSELIQRFTLAQQILQKIKYENMTAQEATEQSLNDMKKRLPGARAGAITVDFNGNVGVFSTAKNIAWGYLRENVLRYGISQTEAWEEIVDVS